MATVNLVEEKYSVGEGEGVKEICVAMVGRAATEVVLQVVTRNGTALCK